MSSYIVFIIKEMEQTITLWIAEDPIGRHIFKLPPTINNNEWTGQNILLPEPLYRAAQNIAAKTLKRGECKKINITLSIPK